MPTTTKLPGSSSNVSGVNTASHGCALLFIFDRTGVGLFIAADNIRREVVLAFTVLELATRTLLRRILSIIFLVGMAERLALAGSLRICVHSCVHRLPFSRLADRYKIYFFCGDRVALNYQRKT